MAVDFDHDLVCNAGTCCLYFIKLEVALLARIMSTVLWNCMSMGEYTRLYNKTCPYGGILRISWTPSFLQQIADAIDTAGINVVKMKDGVALMN